MIEGEEGKKEGAAMNIRRALWWCALLLLWSGSARADTVAVDQLIDGKDTLTVIDEQKFEAGPPYDPQIVVRRLARGSMHFSGLSFSFDALSGSGIFDFFNANDFRLAELVFTITPGGPPRTVNSLFGCGVSSQLKALPFSECHFAEMGDDLSSTVVSFSSSGLAPFSHFAVELTGFAPNAHITATATPARVPEPETILLLLSGVGALLTRRKLGLGAG
jgi:hypothetical protein